MLKGSCLCQQCNYEAEGELFDCLHCHCSICRKLTGSAFASYGGVSKDKFKWVGDTSTLKRYQSPNGVARFFCGDCSSFLVSIDNSEPDTLYLSLGGVDSDNDINPEYHQFVASKASWHEISDDLPQYDDEYVD